MTLAAACTTWDWPATVMLCVFFIVIFAFLAWVAYLVTRK